MAALRRTVLLDKNWRYRSTTSTESSLNSWQPSRPLPTEIHLDLLANNAIPNPFLGKNESAVQWVGEQTWVYEREFIVPGDVFGSSNRKAALVFEGLDTFATVELNGREILKSDNAFISHRVEISPDLLVEGPQHFQITFENAERVGDEEVRKHPEHDWFTLNSVSRLAIRKAQYHYGWDWGPKLMPCGPWKPIYLDLYSSRASDVVVHTTLASDLQYADVKVEVEIEGPATQANITLRRDGVAQQSQVVDVQQHVARTTFRVQNPQLWWPFTLGEPSLYEIGVSLYEKIDESSEPRISDEVTKRFGIRMVELVQNALPDQEGKTFFFKINNVPIFAAGSCWIPADSFVSRISAQRYRDWVKLARDSNQVMIRVWGGGIYEHEAFYDACDELGILVWQDFMFACGNYPAHAELRKNVAAEVDQNVRLLRHHPSIVLWCGNNEDYAMPLIRQIEYDASESDPDKILESNFPARYFYEHMFPAICKDLSPDTPYWPGSPFGGDMVNSEHIGDIHQWHVWHLEMFPYQDYPKLAGRFVSEFGMQALPCLETAKEFFPPGYSLGRVDDFSKDEFVKWHNKMEDGAERMAHYGEPNIDYQTTSLPDYIYGTQLIQSEALSTAYRSWRRLWSGPGKEYCAGALVWQLNDCWPVTSWAIADYYLRPKMAYWAVKRECAAITAGVARVKDGDCTVALDVWAVNMTLADVEVDVSLQAWDVVTGRVILDKKIHKAHVLTKNQSTELGRLELDAHVPADLHPDHRDSGYRDVVFTARLVEAASSASASASASSVAGDEASADDVLAQTVNFHEPLREVSFQARSADLKLKIVKHAGSTVVEASTDVPIKGLLVQVKNDADAKWDDNGVDLVPGQVARLKYTGTGLEMGQEDRLQARWLGGEWGVPQIIRTSL